MESSPLTKQTRPDSFQPKIVQLYNELFDVRPPVLAIGVQSHIYQVREPVPLSEGFWREFFLLPPDKGNLRLVLEGLAVDDILHVQVRACPMVLYTPSLTPTQEHTQSFFARAVGELRSGIFPQNQHALEVGTVILNVSQSD